MNHIMNLQPAPFRMIADGTKTIELRLYDEKRQKIRIGDGITFVNAADPSETLEVTVTDLWRVDSFAALYRRLPLERCGYTESTLPTASPADMDAYYPAARQKQYGVLGIGITKK